MIIDPCCGTGNIFKHLREPKIACDIDPTLCAEPIDFLKATRNNYVTDGPAAICMNPPFRLDKSRKCGVVAFLNHAAQSILHPKEFIICIAPQSVRRVSKRKCDQIYNTLHLVYECIIQNIQPFLDVKTNKTKYVRVVIQVWQVRRELTVHPIIKNESVDDFELCYNPNPAPDFFLQRWTCTKKLGVVTQCDDTYTMKQCNSSSSYNKTEIWLRGKKVGVLFQHTRKTDISGTIIGIRVKEGINKDLVINKFKNLYHSGYWKRYKQHTFSGSDNPSLGKFEICLAYLDKLQFPRIPEEVKTLLP